MVAGGSPTGASRLKMASHSVELAGSAGTRVTAIGSSVPACRAPTTSSLESRGHTVIGDASNLASNGSSWKPATTDNRSRSSAAKPFGSRVRMSVLSMASSQAAAANVSQ